LCIDDVSERSCSHGDDGEFSVKRERGSKVFHHHEDKSGRCRADAEGQRERTYKNSIVVFGSALRLIRVMTPIVSMSVNTKANARPTAIPIAV
jgi:hypothetical protein